MYVRRDSLVVEFRSGVCMCVCVSSLREAISELHAVSVSKNISDGAAFSICSIRCSRSVSSSSICLHVREAMSELHSSLGVEE